MLFTGIKNEFKKLIMMKGFFAFSVLISLIPKSVTYIFMFLNDYIDIRLGSAVFSSHDIMMRFFVPFMAIILSLRIFTREQKKNYVLGYIVKPIGRGTLFMSKIGAIALYLLIMVAINYFFSSFVTMVGQGMVSEDVYKAIMALAISIFPIAIITLLASLVAQFTKSRLINFLIFYSVFAVMGLVGSFEASLYPVTINSTMSFFKLFMGNRLESDSNFMNVVVVVGYIALLAGVSGYVFENKKYKIK